MSYTHAMRRGSALLLAAIIGAAALTTTSRAVGTIKAANEAGITFVLLASATSLTVILPSGEGSMATLMCTTTGGEAIGHAAILRTSAGLTWSGQGGFGGGESGGPTSVSGT